MIILFNPQSSANRKPILPCSLLALGAVLEGKFPYTIVDANLVIDPLVELSALAERYGDDTIFAFTVMPGPQLEMSVPLSKELKRRHPNSTMIWGGYFPTQHWDVCLSADYVDYVCRGHAEMVFLNLLGELANGNSNFETIPGLAYRNTAGEPVSNLLAPIPHPNKLPNFNFDKVPLERYVRNTFMGERTLGYHSSYGCPFFCNFCAVVNMVGGRWLPQSAETVTNVVRFYHEEHGVNAVEFYDNNFFVHEKRVAEFSDRIMDLGVAWWGEGRIDTMLKYKPATWEKMRDAGLKMVFMGAESGSAETLARMDKGGKLVPEMTLEMARIMGKYGIVPEFSFVMGNPPNPEKDIADTMNFIKACKRINPKTEVIMYLYTPVPLEGDLYDQAKESGFAFPKTLEAWISPEWLEFTQRRSGTLPWVGYPLQQRLHDFERVLNAYHPTSTDHKLTGNWRRLLKAVSGWRYHSGFYRFPFELRALHKLVAYQRPETSGF